LLEHFSFGKCEQLGGFLRAKEEFGGKGEILSYLNNRIRTMKLTTIALVTILALTKLGCAGASNVRFLNRFG
jgi:hypothetical protein